MVEYKQVEDTYIKKKREETKMIVLQFVFACFIMLVFLPVIWVIGRALYWFAKTLFSKNTVVSLANKTQNYIIK